MEDDEVGVCGYERGEGGGGGCEIDVCFVYYYDAVIRRVGEELDDVRGRDEGPGWVAGGAEVEDFDCWVGGQGGGDGGDVRAECWGWEEGDGDEGDVVGVCGYGVHPVGRRADEDFISRRDTEGAEEGVDRFVASDSQEEVFGRQ